MLLCNAANCSVVEIMELKCIDKKKVRVLPRVPTLLIFLLYTVYYIDCSFKKKFGFLPDN